MKTLLLFSCIIGSTVAFSQEYPFLEDFEDSDGGWTVSGENASWEWGMPQASAIDASNDGVNAWVTNLDGNMNPNEVSFLTSPTYDISSLSLPEVSFFVKQRGLESLTFEYSTDGGATFESLISFTPNLISNIYSEHTFRLYDVVGASNIIFRFALINESRSSEGVGFDTFSLQESPEDELSVIGHANKRNGIFQSEETLNIQIRNNGSNELSDVLVNADIYYNDELIAERTETISSISIGETVETSFSNTVDLGNTGVYFIKMYHSFEDDAINTDDTLSYYAQHFNAISSLPYSEDFESFPETTYSGNEFSELPGWNNFDVDFPLELSIGNELGLFTNQYLKFNMDRSGEYPALNIDLSSYDLNDVLYVDLSTFIDMSNLFRLYFQSTDESQIIFLKSFSFEDEGSWIDSHINLTELVAEASGSFSNSSRLIFEPSSFFSDFATVDNVRIYEQSDKPVSLSFEGFSAGLFENTGFIVFKNEELVESYLVNVEIEHNGEVNSYDTIIHQDSILENGAVIDFESTYLTDKGEYAIKLLLAPENEPTQIIDSLKFSFFKLESLKPTLPFSMDFESIDAINYTASTFEVDGLPGFSFKMNGTNQTALRINENLGFESSRSVSVASGHDLTWTLDLSDYDTTTDLSLDLNLLPDLFIWEVEDDLRIRGSVNDNWITLDRFFEISGLIKNDSSNYYAQWRKLNQQLSLSDYLKENGQNYSKTTQIQFSGPGFGRYLSYDDIVLYETYSNNLRLWDVISPASFMDTLQDSTYVVRVLNMGVDQITDLAISLEYLNEVKPIETYEYSGLMIAPQDSMDFEVSIPFDFSANGKHEVRVRVLSAQDEYTYDNEFISTIYNRTVNDNYPFVFNQESLDPADHINTYGEFDSVQGYFFNSNLDVAYIGPEIIIWSDATYDVVRGNNHTATISDQDHIWTFDLSEFEIEKDVVEFELEYFLTQFPPDHLETDGIYIRGSVDDEWIPIFLHIDPVSGNIYRSVDELFNLNDLLIDSEQNFSSTSQIKIDLRVSYWSSNLSILNFQLDVEIGEDTDDGDVITSLENNELFNLYPNPNSGTLYVDAFESISSMSVFSLSGQQVKFIDQVGSENDISELDAGLYNITITTITGEKKSYLFVVK